MENKITQKDIENAIYLSQQYQKSIEEKPQPLFTLTAEEVERFERLLRLDYDIHQDGLLDLSDVENREYHRAEKQEDVKILTRIKQWQDENNRTTKEDN